MRSSTISVYLGVLSVAISVFLPTAIFVGQSRIQNQAVCTASVLEFRKNLAEYYALGPSDRGLVLDSEQFPLRVTVQASRDTVYATCANAFDGEDERMVDPDAEPWTQTPASLKDDWSYNNVNALYEETATVLSRVAEAPTWSPLGFGIG